MKKFYLPLLAFVFAGNFDLIAAAAESHNVGSASTFDEDETTTHKTLTFVDANGNAQTITPGDAIQVVENTDGSFKGYVAVRAADASAWLTEVPAAAAVNASTEVEAEGNASNEA